MYNPKFNYHELSRTSEEGKRLYLTPDGRKVPSVTTILDRTKPEEKKAAGGAVKGKVTISPNMDVMQYELLNRKAK